MTRTPHANRRAYSRNQVTAGSVVSTVTSWFDSGPQYAATQLTDDNYADIIEGVNRMKDSDYTLLAVRPPLESEGIQAAARLYQSEDFHTLKLGTFNKQESPAFAHEIRYDDGKIVFYYGVEDDPQGARSAAIQRKLRAEYENADISRARTVFPEIQEREFVAGATIHLQKPFYYPIKSPLTDIGENEPVTDADPYRDLLTDMVIENATAPDGTSLSTSDCRVVVQAVCQPARDCWSKGTRWGMDVKEVARQQKKGEWKTSLVGEEKAWQADATAKDKKAAKVIEKQRGMKGYYVTLRVLAFSPYAEVVQRRVRQLAGDYSKYYESFTEQGLTAEPIPEDELRDEVIRAILRRQQFGTTDRLTQLNQRKFLLSRTGLASICHLPTEEVNVPAVDWATMETGPGVPADAPQMEDLEADDDGDDTSRTRVLNPDSESPAEPAADEYRRGRARNRADTTRADAADAGDTTSTAAADPNRDADPDRARAAGDNAGRRTAAGGSSADSGAEEQQTATEPEADSGPPPEREPDRDGERDGEGEDRMDGFEAVEGGERDIEESGSFGDETPADEHTPPEHSRQPESERASDRTDPRTQARARDPSQDRNDRSTGGADSTEPAASSLEGDERRGGPPDSSTPDSRYDAGNGRNAAGQDGGVFAKVKRLFR